MLPMPSAPPAAASPSNSKAIGTRLEQRHRVLKMGVVAWAAGIGLSGATLPWFPEVGGLGLAVTLILGLLALGALWNNFILLREFRPRTPVPTRVPQVQIYDSLPEAASAGWVFFAPCGTLGMQPIPGYATLNGQWFAYRGLDWEASGLNDEERVFGLLAYRRLSEVPTVSGDAMVFPAPPALEEAPLPA